MRSYAFKFCCFVVALAMSAPVWSQTSSAADQEKGFTAIESFQGSLNSSNKLLRLDSTLGYDFNKHFGVFAGVPLYYSNVLDTSLTTSTTGASVRRTTDGVGNVHLGLAFLLPHPWWTF